MPRGRVVVVEDDPGIRQLLKIYITQNEKILCASFPQPGPALTYLDETTHTINCIISDYEMPQMNGDAFFHRVRKAHPKLPFIFFTSRSADSIPIKLTDSPRRMYLRKSPSENTLSRLAAYLQTASKLSSDVV